MIQFSSVRMRLVGTVFLAVAPSLALMYFLGQKEWAGFLVGLTALAAAWYGGEKFILRQVRVLLDTTQRLSQGDLNSRANLGDSKGELGQLARNFDTLAGSLQLRDHEREDAEHTLMTRALQQTTIAALGQFALVSRDVNALLAQATSLISQTLEVEFVQILELQEDGHSLLLRTGQGWKDGLMGSIVAHTHGGSLASYVFNSGEPVVVTNLRKERRFAPPPTLYDHGIVSGVSVLISTRQRPYGVLSAFTGKPRTFTGDEVHFLLAIAMALGMSVEHGRAEAELQKLASFVQLNPNPAMELAADGSINYFNDAALRLALSMGQDHPGAALPGNVNEIIETCLSTGQSWQNVETKIQARTFSWAFHPVMPSRVVHCYVEEVSERLNLESQLRQAQKMESVGQLAAGVAHDFNNMLTIIQGHAGMLMARPGLTTETLDSAQAVYFASERAASLTRQLLMFSRKNVIQPKSLDVREVVSNMSKMLQRVLGETVKLEFNSPSELPLVHADNGMIEQVIMNLCVNARDAMPKGGRLTIDIGTKGISHDYVQAQPEARPGTFVCIQVTDTGCGMSQTVVDRIFEPFFTTKEVGKGTGLGLATVYGIVKQHEGWIEVQSQEGQGTTFTIFLPASNETAKSLTKDDTDHAAFVRGGDETILVVEDEPVLRDMAQMILQECGYSVITAGSGREAIEIWLQKDGHVDLLLTDMVMPEGVSGVELAETLLLQAPTLKIIFASGYTVDEISTDFLSRNNNARFLQKPYTRTTLVSNVREVLDSEHVAYVPATANA